MHPLTNSILEHFFYTTSIPSEKKQAINQHILEEMTRIYEQVMNTMIPTNTLGAEVTLLKILNLPEENPLEEELAEKIGELNYFTPSGQTDWTHKPLREDIAKLALDFCRENRERL